MKNETITIYELMGLIKDDKAPKKIEYNNEEFDYNFGEYYNTNDINLFNHYAIKAFSIKEIMNLKVEILPEENDEWEDIYTLTDNEEYHFMNRQNGITKEDRRLLDSNFKTLGDTINQLIKNQRKIIEKLDNVKNDVVFDYWKDKVVGKDE